MIQSDLLNDKRCHDHKNQLIEHICFNQFCQVNRLICRNCLKHHSSHTDDLINTYELEDKVSQIQNHCKNLVQQLNLKLLDLQQSGQKLIVSIRDKYILSMKDLNDKDNQQLNNYFQELVNYQNINKNITEIFSLACSEYKLNINSIRNLIGLQEVNVKKISKEQLEMIEKYSKEGDEYFNQADYLNAIKLSDQSLSCDGNHFKSLFRKAQSLRLLNQYQESIEWYNKVLQIEPKHKISLLGKGESLKNMGCFDESINFYNKTLQIDSQQKQALKGKGECLRMQNEFDEAIKCFDQALQIDSDCHEILSQKGACLIDIEEFDEAEKLLTQAIQRSKNDEWCKNQLIRLEEKRKKSQSLQNIK